MTDRKCQLKYFSYFCLDQICILNVFLRYTVNSISKPSGSGNSFSMFSTDMNIQCETEHTCAIVHILCNRKWFPESNVTKTSSCRWQSRQYVGSEQSMFWFWQTRDSVKAQCQAWPPLTNNMSSSGHSVVLGEEQLPGFRWPVSICGLYYQ